MSDIFWHTIQQCANYTAKQCTVWKFWWGKYNLPPPQVDKGLTEIYQNLEKQSLLDRPLPPRFLRPYCQLRLCHSTPAQFRGTFLFCCVKVHIIWEGHKSKVKISQNFVAFSEYMNFILTIPPIVVIQLGSFFVNQA